MTPLRILIADDDRAIREALTRALTLEGYDVVQAPDGAQGVRMAREQRPDVVLMDIRMPLLNGIDATAQLHSQPDPPRVLVLTTYQAVDCVLDALAAGGRVLFRYAEGTNPNGSVGDIAGLCDERGLVWGLMPHPEDHVSDLQNPFPDRPGRSGLALFEAFVNRARSI